MSNRASKRTILKSLAKTWTRFDSVPITDEMRQKHAHLKHCAAIYSNSRFEIQIFTVGTPIGGVQQVTLVRHGDIETVSWDEIQRIKSEIFGPEATAVEVYPPMVEEWKTRMGIRVLWILPQTWELPFGLTKAGAWGAPTT